MPQSRTSKQMRELQAFLFSQPGAFFLHQHAGKFVLDYQKHHYPKPLSAWLARDFLRLDIDFEVQDFEVNEFEALRILQNSLRRLNSETLTTISYLELPL